MIQVFHDFPITASIKEQKFQQMMLNEQKQILFIENSIKSSDFCFIHIFFLNPAEREE